MNEIDHYFDMEIEQAQERIVNEDTMCFNGVKVSKSIGKELNEKHIAFCENAKQALGCIITDRNCQIAEMQKHIDCLKAELENTQLKLKAEKSELRTRCKGSAIDNFDKHLYGLLHIVGAEDLKTHTVDLPLEPVDVASMLINTRVEYDPNSLRGAFRPGKERCQIKYSANALRQIAEHLLVYCNHNSEEGN